MGVRIGPTRLWLKGKEYPGLVVTRSIGDTIAHQLEVTENPCELIRD